MKLHLPKGLRTALLAVVSAATAYLPATQAAAPAAYTNTFVTQEAWAINPDTNTTILDDNVGSYFDFGDTPLIDKANTTDWVFSIDCYNADTATSDNEPVGIGLFANSAMRVEEGTGKEVMEDANSMGISISPSGKIKLVASDDDAGEPHIEIKLGQLDINWEKNPEAGPVNLRLVFSWDADGGFSRFDGTGNRYGALTLQHIYLLSNDASHTVIGEVRSFYSEKPIIRNYDLRDDMFSKKEGFAAATGDGGQVKATLQTATGDAAWVITGEASINGLLGGEYYNELTGEKLALSTETQTTQVDGVDVTTHVHKVVFSGNSGALVLTDEIDGSKKYRYNHTTLTQKDLNAADVSVGFGAAKDLTLVVDKALIESLVLAEGGASVRVVGDGTTELEIDNTAVRDITIAGTGENSTANLAINGNMAVTTYLGNAELGKNSSINLVNMEGTSTTANLKVVLVNAKDNATTVSLGSISNKTAGGAHASSGSLVIDGRKIVTTTDEDDQTITTKYLSTLVANSLSSMGDISIDANTRISGAVEAGSSLYYNDGSHSAGSIKVDAGNFNVGSTTNHNVSLIVAGDATVNGGPAIYGTAVIGGKLESTNSIFVQTATAETASLSAGSIVAPSVQAKDIAIKGKAKQNLLSGGATINSKGIIAGTIEEDTEIYLNSEDVAVTASNVKGAGIYHGVIDNGDLILNMVTHENGTISINKLGTTATGKMTAWSSALPDNYTLNVADLTIRDGLNFQSKMDSKGLNTEGETTLKNASISLTQGTAESIKASAISLGIGYTLNGAELTAANGITMKADATLNNATAKSKLITEGDATLSNVVLEKEWETKSGTVTMDKVAIANGNTSFGGADGSAFEAVDKVNSITLSGKLTTDTNAVTIDATGASIDAKNLEFGETEVEYVVLQGASGANTISGLTEPSKIDLNVKSYTWAEVEAKGNEIVITGYKDEEGIKAALTDTEARKDALEAIESATMAEGGVLTDLHDAMGDVLHKSNEQRQEILDAISGASTTALADSQRRGIMEVQGNLRNRIVQMGGNADWETAGIQAWAQADASFSSSDSGDDGPGYDYNTWGATVGANVDISETVTVGMSFSASYGELDVDSADNASGNNDAYYVNLFARHQSGRWMQMLIFTAGMNDMDLERNVNGYTGEGSTDGTSFSAYYELGYTLGLNDEFTHILQPMVNARISSAKVDGYTEKGSIGDAALEYDGDSYVYGSVGIGVRYQGVIYESVYERNAVLELRAQVTQDFGDSTDEAGVRIGDGDLFTVAGTDTTGTGFDIGAGISAPVGMQTTLFADADVSIRPDYTGFRANVGLRYDF